MENGTTRSPRYLDDGLLERIGAEARNSPRLRRNHNFHRHEDAVQRLLNALQPGTYIPPHRHDGPDSFELFVVLRGRIGLLTFDDGGEITSAQEISAQGNVRGVEIPGETWHTLVCLEEDAVILEIKEGPYDPQSAKAFLPGFPEELTYLGGDDATALLVKALLADWRGRFGT